MRKNDLPIEKEPEENHIAQQDSFCAPFLNNALNKETCRTYKHLHSALFSLFSLKFSHHQ